MMHTAKVLAKGQSRLVKNSDHSNRPMVKLVGPPNNSGIKYSPTAGINTKLDPAEIPDRDNGTVIRQKAEKGRHPRS